MLYYGILFAIGLLLVLKGGDLFVDSACNIATRLKIPRIVIGGTIVSLATTMPELVVSTTASYMGDAGIAVGNAVGSAIANIGLIVSITAILTPIAIDVKDFRRRALWMFLSAILVFIFSWDLHVGYFSGITLLIIALSYLFFSTLRAILERKNIVAPIDNITGKETSDLPKIILAFLVGIVLVVVGSKLLVNSGIAIAQALKVPSLVIGLTAVAVGTSLPELVTAITSAKKKTADLAIGNIIGANILNLAFITGASAIIRPLSLDFFTRNYAFSWLFIMVFALILSLWKNGKMGKKSGIIILSLYILYNLGLVLFTANHEI